MTNSEYEIPCIPNSHIKASQIGIAGTLLVAIVAQQWWLIFALLLLQLVSIKFGMKLNMFVQIGKLFMTKSTDPFDVQSVELTRFNNGIATIMLTGAGISLALGWHIGAYLFSGFVFLAASTAVLGYCIGCTLYFQYKQMKARHRQFFKRFNLN